MNSDTLSTTLAPRALSLFRIITGLLIVQHGMAKLVGFPVVASFANLQPLSLLGAAGFIELIGGALLIVGLWTRPAALVVAINMLVAVLLVHTGQLFLLGKSGGWALELQGMYFFAAIAVALLGAGRFSLGGGNGRLN